MAFSLANLVSSSSLGVSPLDLAGRAFPNASTRSFDADGERLVDLRFLLSLDLDLDFRLALGDFDRRRSKLLDRRLSLLPDRRLCRSRLLLRLRREAGLELRLPPSRRLLAFEAVETTLDPDDEDLDRDLRFFRRRRSSSEL